MTDKQIICAEIEKLRKEYDIDTTPIAKYQIAQAILNRLSNVIDSLQEEPVSEDKAEKYFKAGDVVMYVSRHPAYSGLYLLGNPNDLSLGYSNANEPYQIALRNCTVASEDERRQFMHELELNGYKWNESALKIEKKEPVSEDLDRAAEKYAYELFPSIGAANTETKLAFKAGAQWQKEHLWKSADGDDLPEIEREVIAIVGLEDNGYKVVFAHRVNTDGYNGKSLITGETIRYVPKGYDKGGWNMPDVVYWLDTELPFKDE